MPCRKLSRALKPMAFTGAAGQPIELINIGKDVPPAWGLFQRLALRNLGAGISLRMGNHGWMMGRGD
jgi:hypothetical protein